MPAEAFEFRAHARRIGDGGVWDLLACGVEEDFQFRNHRARERGSWIYGTWQVHASCDVCLDEHSRQASQSLVMQSFLPL